MGQVDWKRSAWVEVSKVEESAMYLGLSTSSRVQEGICKRRACGWW